MWNNLFFQNSAVYYFFFFLLFLTFFFYFVYLYLSKNSGNFYVFLFYGLEILSNIFEKSWNVFLKNICLKSKIRQKFHYLLFVVFIFLAFLAFCFLFHVPKLVKKLWNFLWCFIRRVRYFTNDFWKILKVLLKKILICEIFFF